MKQTAYRCRDWQLCRSTDDLPVPAHTGKYAACTLNTSRSAAPAICCSGRRPIIKMEKGLWLAISKHRDWQLRRPVGDLPVQDQAATHTGDYAACTLNKEDCAVHCPPYSKYLQLTTEKTSCICMRSSLLCWQPTRAGIGDCAYRKVYRLHAE